MSDNVVKGVFPEKEKSDGQAVLDAASGMGLEEAIVVGWTKEGKELYFATTTQDVPEILYLLRKVEFEILKADDGE